MAPLCSLASTMNITSVNWLTEQNCVQLLYRASDISDGINKSLLHFLSSPILWAWLITFFVVYILISLLGFSPHGVVAGSVAAGFQSWMYGGFTPAGGIFATFTSLAMLGILNPIGFGAGVIFATIVVMIVWLAS